MQGSRPWRPRVAGRAVLLESWGCTGRLPAPDGCGSELSLQESSRGENVTLALAQSLNLTHQRYELRQEPRRPQRLYFSPRSFHLTFCVLKNTGSHQMALESQSAHQLLGRRHSEPGPGACGLFQNISRAAFTLGPAGNLYASGCSGWMIALLLLEETNEMRLLACH